MANQDQLAILKQGPEVWNEWRQNHPGNKVNLCEANLSKINLHEANLSRAYLGGANLRWANLDGANLSKAFLNETNLSWAFLTEANLDQAILIETVFASVDLSTCKGLETCQHIGPSIIDHRTLQRSGLLPRSFLRGVGLPDNLIDYLPLLLNQPIQFYSCFISYSSKDQAFAERLHADLQGKGVRCWFAPHDMRTGDKIRTRIDEAIHIHQKLLLVLSKNAIASNWVEKEVETAFEREQKTGATVLFPIRLDDAARDLKTGWAADIKRSRHITNFTGWEDRAAYQNAFDRLLYDLKFEAVPNEPC